MDRLVLLTEQERAAIRPSADQTGYEDALALLRLALEGAAPFGPDALHPTGSAEQFAARADQHLDMLGITGDLWELARGAVRAILV